VVGFFDLFLVDQPSLEQLFLQGKTHLQLRDMLLTKVKTVSGTGHGRDYTDL
jgi:hypothetical protein